MSGGRVGLVVVSHSRALADAAVSLALEMVTGDPPPVAVAAGTEDGGTGTDATAVLAALEQVGGPAGVLVVMDLGSAVLSAEMALELAGDPGFEVRLSRGPFVEGVVAAVVQAAVGADLAEVAAEAERAGSDKSDHLGAEPDHPAAAPTALTAPIAPTAPTDQGDLVVDEVEVVNAHGLHARPAAALVALARGHDADVRLTDLTTGRGPASARSLVAVQTLGAVQGHRLRVEAEGSGAAAAVRELVALVADGFGEDVGRDAARPAPPSTAPPAPPGRAPTGDDPPQGAATAGVLRGRPGAAGVGVGPLWLLDRALPPVPTRASGSVADEQRRLDEAVTAVGERVRAAAGSAPPEHRGIFEAHALLLQDEALLDGARRRVGGGDDAAAAWQGAVDDVLATFAGVDDEYLAARAADVDAVGVQVRRVLQGVSGPAVVSRRGVLVADDLAPDEVRVLDPALVTAVVTARGSATSHAAILARAAGLPLVVAAGPAALALPEGTVLAVDGGTGEVVVDPDEQTRHRWARGREEQEQRSGAALVRAAEPAVTRDGVRVDVAANAAGAEDAREAAARGADGVGLLRTELVFHGRADAPTEDEQVEAYTAAAAALGGRRLVVRTLDVGGDKPVAYADQPDEDNPFLGLRGLRLSLARPELLATQLRAVVRTALSAPLGVMFPMVTTVQELRRAREALHRAARDVGLGDRLPDGLEVGVMVEVPAAALRTRHLAPLVDFLSIGTNDLTQYVLAAERGNAHVADLADGLDPAVLAMVDRVCRDAGPDVRVAVCGELAADPLATAVLVGLGVNELSVSPRAVPEVKQRVRDVDAGDAAGLARRCLASTSAGDVRALLAPG